MNRRISSEMPISLCPTPSEQGILSNAVLGRRAFMAFVGGALASVPIPAFAQQAPVRKLGLLMGLADDAETKARLNTLTNALAAEGWFAEKNLHIEKRYSGGDFERMEAFAKELVTLKPDCILGHSTPVVDALMRYTRTIPIVFVAVTDPIGSGFVASIARPAGNATGFTLLQPSITGKYLSLLRELVPQLARVALIYNPESEPNMGAFFLQSFTEAANRFKIKPMAIQIRSQAEIETGMAQLAEKHNTAFMVVPDNFITFHRERFISLAARYRIPAIYPYRYFVEQGGLLSYGVDALDLFRRASEYVSRILRGASPADLPVQSPTKFELVINLKTAKDLGLALPEMILAAADDFIE